MRQGLDDDEHPVALFLLSWLERFCYSNKRAQIWIRGFDRTFRKKAGDRFRSSAIRAPNFDRL